MTATTIRVQMAQRKDTAANWTAANPILLSGEIGYETDTEKFKIGDGTTNWNSLAYLPIPDGSGNLTITGNLEIGSTGTLTFEGSTADGFETTLAVTDPTADRTITLPDVSGTVVTTGDTGSVTSTMIADGTIVNADVSATAEIAVSKLANGTANQVLVTDGTDVSWSDDLTLAGNLTVNGTTTTVNTETLVVEDKNIELGVVGTPTDVTADGGGITLKGTTDKTINWVDATDAWTFSEHVDLASGKEVRIAGTKVMDATSLGSGVVSSSLTSLGTIGTGVWEGTEVGTAYGGTGQTTYTDGQLLIGKTDGTLAKATVTAGTGITVTNGDGTITIDAVNNGTVTAVTGTSPIASTGGATPDISIQDGTTTQKGAVQLEDSTSSTSTTTAATPNSVKAAYDLAAAAIPSTGGVMTGDLVFEGSTADDFETTLTVVDPTADRTITLPDVTGTVVTTGDSGSITSTMIADGTIVDGDINASAAIADTKLATIATAGKVSNSATTATDANTASAIVARDASGNFAAGTITADLAGNAATVTTNANLTGDVTSVGNATSIAAGVIVDADVNASAAIAGTKISPDFGAQNVTTTGTSTAASFIPTSSTVPTNGVYLPAANSVAISSNSSERIRIGANGEIGLSGANYGTSGQVLTSAGSGAAPTWQTPAAGAGDKIEEGNTSAEVIDTGTDGRFVVTTEGVEALRVDSSQRVGIGTTSPQVNFDIAPATSSAILRIHARTDTSAEPAIELMRGANATFGSDTYGDYRIKGSGGNLILEKGADGSTTEVLRTDGDRLLVGTSSARSAVGVTSAFQVEGTGYDTSSLSLICNANSAGIASNLILGKSRGTSLGSNTVVQSGDTLGDIAFAGADGSDLGQYAAKISAEVDGTPGANDMPGRLVFSTTADGASSPTERMRITGGGTPGVHIGNTGFNVNAVGVSIGSSGSARGLVEMVRDSADCLRVSRLTNDGTIVEIRQGTVAEGSISVSGNTVSYNQFLGSHWAALSDWSRPEIKIGTILEAVNELTDWKYAAIEVEGEQKKVCYNGIAELGSTVLVEYEGKTYEGIVELETDSEFNKAVKVKINDTAASKAVYGVFVGWNNDSSLDGGTWNDMYVGAVGNYVIRMASGQTPEIGDLVEADGTGCAVVQDDDIIRTKTVAKITSNIPQVTYNDGSFLVTCVLYCG